MRRDEEEGGKRKLCMSEYRYKHMHVCLCVVSVW